MLVRLMLAAMLCAPAVARADDKGEIDWARRVLKARGQGAPDLSAPSISVARLGAERAAKADAMRNLLELLKGATVTNGARVGTLLQNDNALKTTVSGALRGFTVVKGKPGKPNPHYYSDGGVAIDVELAIDSLPPELAKGLKPPEGAAPPGEDQAEPITLEVIVDLTGLERAGDSPHLVDESDNEISVNAVSYQPSVKAARKASRNEMAVVKALRSKDGTVTLSNADAQRLREANELRVVYVF